MARGEFDADFAARERAPILSDHHLEALRPIMSGPMDLGSAEKRDVVALAQVIHKLRDELLGRQAAEVPILRGNDDVKTAKWSGSLAAALKAAKRRSYGGQRDAEGFAGVLRREVISPSRGERADEVGC